MRSCVQPSLSHQNSRSQPRSAGTSASRAAGGAAGRAGPARRPRRRRQTGATAALAGPCRRAGRGLQGPRWRPRRPGGGPGGLLGGGTWYACMSAWEVRAQAEKREWSGARRMNLARTREEREHCFFIRGSVRPLRTSARAHTFGPSTMPPDAPGPSGQVRACEGCELCRASEDNEEQSKARAFGAAPRPASCAPHCPPEHAARPARLVRGRRITPAHACPWTITDPSLPQFTHTHTHTVRSPARPAHPARPSGRPHRHPVRAAHLRHLPGPGPQARPGSADPRPGRVGGARPAGVGGSQKRRGVDHPGRRLLQWHPPQRGGAGPGGRLPRPGGRG